MAKLIPVAASRKLKPGQPVCLAYRGVPYCVIKVKNDKLRAFVTVCSHKDLAMYPPDVKKQTLVCPFHEAAFDMATGKLAKKSRKKAARLPKVKVKIMDGIVHIAARKKHQKLLPKSERKWVAQEDKKQQKKRKRG